GPVHFKAAATTMCAGGIASMAIYTAPQHLAYSIRDASLDTWLRLDAGVYQAIVEAWDNCQNSAQLSLTMTVTSSDSALPDSNGSQTLQAGATSTATTTSTTTCGPPSYCSRTDTKVVRYPNPLPNFGGLKGIN